MKIIVTQLLYCLKCYNAIPSFFHSVISSTLLVILLIICVTVSTLIIIILVKGKLKIKHELEEANGQLKVNSGVSIPQHTDEAIDTTDKNAYGLHNYN